MMYIMTLTPFTVSTQRDAELAGSMVKLISSRYDSTAKHSAENIPQVWNPPLINRYTQ